MDEKDLKTSPKQRFFIIVIAVLMLGSIIASYAAIILNGGKSATSSSSTETSISQEKIAEYEEAYSKKVEEFKTATKSDFDRLIKYKSEIVAYNEAAANNGGIKVRDLEIGSGRELTEGDTDYLAYYVGWCADESIFDSSFDNDKNPTAFSGILDASLGMIEGWNAGVEGMKLGGIREVTISSELAYGDKREICGGYNKPLKFLIMALANEGSLGELAAELDEAQMKLQYANYGIDYDQMMTSE